MADRIASISEYSREAFFEPFVKYLSEIQGFSIIDENKPQRIKFRLVSLTKDSTIELSPAGKGFDIYVDLTFGLMYKFGGGLMMKGSINDLILGAVHKAKKELASAPKIAAETKFCTKCGASLPLDAVYCQKCGSRQP